MAAQITQQREAIGSIGERPVQGQPDLRRVDMDRGIDTGAPGSKMHKAGAVFVQPAGSLF